MLIIVFLMSILLHCRNQEAFCCVVLNFLLDWYFFSIRNSIGLASCRYLCDLVNCKRKSAEPSPQAGLNARRGCLRRIDLQGAGPEPFSNTKPSIQLGKYLDRGFLPSLQLCGHNRSLILWPRKSNTNGDRVELEQACCAHSSLSQRRRGPVRVKKGSRNRPATFLMMSENQVRGPHRGDEIFQGLPCVTTMSHLYQPVWAGYFCA